MPPSHHLLIRLLLLSALLSWTLGAVAPPGGQGTPIGKLSFKVYGADHGLGNLSPWALAQDRVGFIWVGTEDGLYRFDGHRFQSFGLKHGLPSSFVDNLHVDSEGILWAGTYKGLSYLKEDRFLDAGTAMGLPHAQVTGVCTGPDGQVWVGMSEGLFRRRRPFPGGAGLARWNGHGPLGASGHQGALGRFLVEVPGHRSSMG
jgi:ligand-binding sensor domain-containing protein